MNQNLNSTITGEDKTVHGYSNHETYTMIVHIHNDQGWLEDAFETIRQYNNSRDLKLYFKHEIFNNGGLSDIFGKMSFDRINWFEIFDNLKVMMRVEKFTIGDYLMILDGDGLKFDWKGRIFQHDCTYTEAFNRDEEICVWDCENDKLYNVNQNRFIKVYQKWVFIAESDRWVSEWRDANDDDVVAVNYFQGHDSFDNLREDFFLPGPQLTEKVLAKKMDIDSAIWSVHFEENVSKEELIERLALANTQARILFDQLRELGDGADTMVEELSHAHNIKLLTDITNDEYKFDK